MINHTKFCLNGTIPTKKCKNKLLRILVWFLTILFLIYYPVKAYTIPGDTELISLANDGGAANGYSHAPALSADGQVVVFLSESSNLVADDHNNLLDVFTYDRRTRTTRLISVSSTGEQSNGLPSRPAISADGRYVVFSSDANNLVADDTNGRVQDVFLHDTQSGETSLISVSSSGDQGNHDSFTRRPSISGDGRFVVFFSSADNLVTGDENGVQDVFLHDRDGGKTTRISSAADSGEANGDSVYPTISTDGRFIAYYSSANNLVADDDNQSTDVFLYDRQTEETFCVSVDSDGVLGNAASELPAISADGRYVSYFSLADNLVEDDVNEVGDIFIHDSIKRETTRVSINSQGGEANGSSDVPSLSADGRFVAFYSYANNLVPGDDNNYTDVFRHDRLNGTTVRVSLKSDGTQGDNHSICSAISADGDVVAFYSHAENLVDVDNNNFADIFVHDLSTNRVYLPFVNP